MVSRMFAASCAITVALAGCSNGNPPAPVEPPPESASVRAAASPAATEDVAVAAGTYESELLEIDRRIGEMRKVADANPRSPAAWERVAGAVLARARLTGDYDDYAEAEALVERAFSIAEGYGPWMTRARLSYTLHRLDRVDADFDRHRALRGKDDAARAADLAFAGNLALQRGRYEEAARLFEQSLAAKRTFTNLSSFAVYRWKTGDHDGAQALFREALGTYRGRSREPIAWTHLQLGLMDLDRGRHDEALAHYRDAEAAMKGWWLVDEHIAEVLALTGKTEEAKALYLDIIRRTDNPEFMDAMAGILLDEGKEAEAAEYVERAQLRFEALLGRYPEAAYGHALEHFLQHARAPARALEMAQRNRALRPNADAEILLAQAYLGAGKPREAKTAIDRALRTPWATADLHATAAEVFEALGDARKAERQRIAAREINPHHGS
jgi:tetratricopeptide (TPR) repeat protein